MDKAIIRSSCLTLHLPVHLRRQDDVEVKLVVDISRLFLELIQSYFPSWEQDLPRESVISSRPFLQRFFSSLPFEGTLTDIHHSAPSLLSPSLRLVYWALVTSSVRQLTSLPSPQAALKDRVKANKMPAYGKKKNHLSTAITSKYPITGGKHTNNSDFNSPATLSISAFYDNKTTQLGGVIDKPIGIINSSNNGNVPESELSGRLGKIFSYARPSTTQDERSISPDARVNEILQLPQLKFDDEIDWGSQGWIIDKRISTHEANNVVRTIDQRTLSLIDSCPPDIPLTHSQKRISATPPVPRRSSKRKQISAEKEHRRLSKSMDTKHRRTLTNKSHIGKPQLIGTPERTRVSHGQEVSKKIQEMLLATQNLKPTATTAASDHDSASLSNQQTAGSTKMFDKVKRTYDRFWNRTRESEPVKGGHIKSLDKVKDGDSLKKVKSLELRHNEDINLIKSTKVRKLTGQAQNDRGSVQVDQLDKAPDDPFFESSIIRKPVQDESQVQDVSIEDRSEPSPRTGSKNHSHPISDFLKKPPAGTRTVAEAPSEFERLLSSSPSHQITPRRRLEPTSQSDGTRKLMNVPANTRSLFDPQLSTSRSKDFNTLNKSSSEMPSSPPVMVPKQERPSHEAIRVKEPLDTLGPHRDPPYSESLVTSDPLPTNRLALANKDRNKIIGLPEEIHPAKRTAQAERETTIQFSRDIPGQTQIPKSRATSRKVLSHQTSSPGLPSHRNGRSVRTLGIFEDNPTLRRAKSAGSARPWRSSDCDTDELQWNSDTYNIGRPSRTG